MDGAVGPEARETRQLISSAGKTLMLSLERVVGTLHFPSSMLASLSKKICDGGSNFSRHVFSMLASGFLRVAVPLFEEPCWPTMCHGGDPG